mmetsp:Transcript_11718/g.19896  ORF Transcript_11718/g.19896 Transcript_11718/m.19896 type:complete len:492 (+) Transcript_11718:328-1803(+)|eukprot:CAMPEP_0198199224 /NCGR_PEP_ID=MMETSP1445-20131203/2538_1 /TAXON_ID=36898 /ORGANISM="Pyramimonas sp., Strain CCMP2087" /LENGTH=491 /DNA_ID=CAMNT_0043869001 /DNA_START=306 /DNA_END=1781 /DNA_ORIENTATION=+
MALLNIGQGNADDVFYRYKMPSLQSKIEGRGNGIKTNIVNMVEVAKALARPPSYTTKYFGCELGAQSKFDEKTGTSIVNGAHDKAILLNLLEGFIKRFVQCFACGNPETEVGIAKGENITLQCKACGNVSHVDMRHKLTTFILKNPPAGVGGKKDKDAKKLRRAEQERLEAGDAVDAAEKAAKKEARRALREQMEKEEVEAKAARKEKRRLAKEAAANGITLEDDKDEKDGSNDDDDEEDKADDGVQWSTDVSAAAQAARAIEQLTDASRKMVSVKDPAEILREQAIKDAAAEALARSKAAEEAAAAAAATAEALKQATLEDDDEDDEEDEEDEEDMIEGLRMFAQSHTPAQLAAFLPQLPVDDSERIKLLVLALFADDASPILPRIKAKQAFLKEACAENALLQYALLVSVELLLGLKSPELSKDIAHVLKHMYDTDLVAEEVILEWHDKANAAKEMGVDAGTAAELRKTSFPVVNWLRTAESDDESDEE